MGPYKLRRIVEKNDIAKRGYMLRKVLHRSDHWGHRGVSMMGIVGAIVVFS